MSTAAALGYLARIPRPGWTWPAEDAPDPREPQEHAVDMDREPRDAQRLDGLLIPWDRPLAGI